MGIQRKKRVFLGLDTDNFPDLHAKSDAIYNGLADHPGVFANPNPPLAILKDRIQAFYDAQQAVATRSVLAYAERDIKAGELISCLETSRAYVQSLCDESPEKAIAIAKAAAMRVGAAPVRSKSLLGAKQRQPGGAVQLNAHVGILTAETEGRVFFNWQVSIDGGATWSSLPSTSHGNTLVEGLKALQVYAFRVSVTDANGPGAWSQAITFLAH